MLTILGTCSWQKWGRSPHIFQPCPYRNFKTFIYPNGEKMEDIDVLWRDEWHRKGFLYQPVTGCWNLIADIILMHIQGIHLNSTEPLDGGRWCVWKYYTSVLQTKLRFCYYLFTRVGGVFVCFMITWTVAFWNSTTECNSTHLRFLNSNYWSPRNETCE